MYLVLCGTAQGGVIGESERYDDGDDVSNDISPGDHWRVCVM